MTDPRRELPMNAPRVGETALSLAGETLVLRADHSLFWPAARTLFVADTHFGKAGVFRRQGLNVPQGTTDADLARLARALEDTGARRLVVLGDFVHAPPAADAAWLARFAAWRARHGHIEIVVTRGNHDRVERLPHALDIEWHAGAKTLGPFVAQHEPDASVHGPVLAGHLHPVVRLQAGSERVRLPAFWRHEAGLVLPAFCSFAGGARIDPRPRDAVFVVADNDVLAVAVGG